MNPWLLFNERVALFLHKPFIIMEQKTLGLTIGHKRKCIALINGVEGGSDHKQVTPGI